MKRFPPKLANPLLVLASMLLAPAAGAAELQLSDGSIVYGTIVKLVDSEDFIVDTPHMGEVTIDWEAVDRIDGTQVVEVELFDGRQAQGGIRVDGGVLTVWSADPMEVPPREVFSMSEVNDTLGERIDAYTDLGSNFVRGNNQVTQLTLGAGVSYTSTDWISSLKLSSIVNEQTDAEDTERFTLNADYAYEIDTSWQAFGFYQFESDEQQRLTGRSLVGGGFGKRLLNERRHRLLAYSGLVMNIEEFEGQPREESPEAFLRFKYRLRWRFDADLSYTVFPSLTDSGRVRTQLDGSLSFDVLSDLDFRLTVYDRYDSKPPPGNTSNDSGLTMGLRWEY